MCRVTLLNLEPVVSRDFEMEARSDKNGRQHGALNKGWTRVSPSNSQALPHELSLFLLESSLRFYMGLRGF